MSIGSAVSVIKDVVGLLLRTLGFMCYARCYFVSLVGTGFFVQVLSDSIWLYSVKFYRALFTQMFILFCHVHSSRNGDLTL